MTATLSVQPPLAEGLARYGFGHLPLAALKARYASPESGSKFIHVDGFDIHYRDEGSPDKPVLVMVHGVMASLHTWDGWVAELSEHAPTAPMRPIAPTLATRIWILRMTTPESRFSFGDAAMPACWKSVK